MAKEEQRARREEKIARGKKKEPKEATGNLTRLLGEDCLQTSSATSIETRRLKWHWMEVTLNLPAKEWCPVDPPNTNNINVCDWNENITMKIGPTSSILSYDFGFGC